MLDQIVKVLKYQRFTPSYSTDIGVRKFEFVAKTHFLYKVKKLKLVFRANDKF